MTINLNRYKNKQKEILNEIISDIKKKNNIGKYIEFIFPLIHGVELIEEKDYEINNIIEAREYLNDKFIFSNILDVLNLLLKNKKYLNDLMSKKDLEKLQSSITLFNYITNTNFKNLLLFRGYEEKLIKKIFIENKEYNIFKEILEKLFDNCPNRKTILLIESEMLDYSLKENTLKNIEKSSLEIAENLLIKYSEFSPLVVSSMNHSEVLRKSKEYFKSLTNEEYEIFSKFDIDKTILKYAYRVRGRIKNKIMINLIPTILLLGLIILGFNNSPTTAYITDKTIAVLPTESCMPAFSEFQTIEEIKKTKEEEIRAKELEEQKRQEEIKKAEEKKYYTPTYNYIEPTGVGNVDVVNIAMSQVGNVGGYPYWSWYGFASRVDWCSIFVSWVANQAGISENIIPKFARASVGASWFMNNSLFRGRDYVPREGDLIFFDWDYNGISDHAGYVRYADGGTVYTVEGNTLNDDCSTHSYPMNSAYILGYGTPNY